jgi:hypothetical protein
MNRANHSRAAYQGPAANGAGHLTLESLFTSLQEVTSDDATIVCVVKNLCDRGVLRRMVDPGRVLH